MTTKNNAASDVQPVELAEPQGDAPEIEQLRNLVSSILSTVSLGHQTGPYAYAGEDFGRYLREATSDCRTILRMLPTLAAPPAQGIDLGQPRPLIARSLAEWHEDDGNVMWWAWCGRYWAGEPAWCGTPNDSDWPGYHTHWTQHPVQPALIDGQRDAAPGVGNG